MRTLAIRLSLLCGLACTLATGCAIIVNPGEAREEFSISTADDGVDELRVRWVNGKITVRFDETATEITAAGTKRVTAASDEDADEGMAEFEINFETTSSVPGRRTLRFEAPDRPITTVFTAEVEVVLPAGVTLDIESANGDVSVTGNVGVTEIQLTNGSVEVTEQAGDTMVTVANGSVDVDSSSGNVDVVIANGSVTVAARPADDGSVLASTNVGSVEIMVPADVKATVELRGAVGQVSADLDAFDSVDDLTTGPATITATLNGGGGQIVGTSAVGTVDLGAH